MYLTTNGTPIVIADSRDEAAERLNVSSDYIFQLDELSPRDRHTELVEAMSQRRLYGVAC